jgi:hypothetical protein
MLSLLKIAADNWTYIATAVGGAAGFKSAEVAVVAGVAKVKAWLAAKAAKVEADAKAVEAKAEADAKQLDALIGAHVTAALADVKAALGIKPAA